jgi:G:T/U-mismatch repair DNA glycosylase
VGQSDDAEHNDFKLLMTNHATTIVVDGREVPTLEDILPRAPGLRALFIGKTPAPTSVEAGHYFQGNQGKIFWNRLREYGVLVPATEYEDDSLLAHGFGLTDIVKAPRRYRVEPSDHEYRAGLNRVLDLIPAHRPRVVVFVYKKVIDKILQLKFGIRRPTTAYGFNPQFEKQIGTRVFAFPLPGVGGCTQQEAASAMRELTVVLKS